MTFNVKLSVSDDYFYIYSRKHNIFNNFVSICIDIEDLSYGSLQDTYNLEHFTYDSSY